MAVKILIQGALADDETRRRFLREAEVVRRIDHPGVLPVLDVGQADGHEFLVMPLLSGQSIASRLRFGSPSWSEVASWLSQAANALAAVHDKGIVHCDVKPGNLLLDDSQRCCVGDFGLARTTHPNGEVSVNTVGLGTLVYLAPEQASSDLGPVSHATDIHGLGATLYHCLTGRPPFQGANIHRLLHSIVNEDPPDPRSLNPEVPVDLETICLKCLEKSPAARYRDMTSLQRDLDAFLSGGTITASRRPIARVIWSQVRRRPRLFAGAAITVAALALVQIVTLWHAERLNRANTSLHAEVTRSALREARYHEQAGRTGAGLSALIRHLRNEPMNQAVADRLVSALTWRSWPLPLARFGPSTNGTTYASSTADGKHVVVADASGRVSLWDLSSGTLDRSWSFARNKPGGQRIPLSFGFSAPTGWALAMDASRDLEAWEVTGNRSWRHPGNGRIRASGLYPHEPWALVVNDERWECWNLESSQLKATGSLGELAEVGGSIGLATDGDRILIHRNDQILLTSLEAPQNTVIANGGVGAIAELTVFPKQNAVLVRGSTLLRKLTLPETRELWRVGLVDGLDAATISPNGEEVAVSLSLSRGTQLLDGSTGMKKWQTEPGYECPLENSFSEDGRSLLVSLARSAIGIRSVADGRRISEDLGLSYALETTAFLPAQGGVLVADNSSYAWWIDVRPGAAKPWFFGDNHTVLRSQVESGREFVFEATDQRAQMWEIRTRSKIGNSTVVSGKPLAVALSPRGDLGFLADTAGKPRCFVPRTGQTTALYPLPSSAATAAAFSPDGSVLAVVFDDLHLWIGAVKPAIAEGVVIALKPKGKPSGPNTTRYLRFDPSGRRLLVPSEAGVYMVDIPQRRVQWSLPTVACWNGIFSGEGSKVLALDSSKLQVLLLDAMTGGELTKPLPHSDFPSYAIFGENDHKVYSASMERQLRIWDVSNGNLVGYRAEHDEGILGISFSPDERRMATSSKDRSIRIWEMETGESLSEAMLGHGGSNVSLAEFCAGDSCLVAFSRMSGGLSYWPAARVPVPVPEWILEIAAILSGPENGVREPVERSGLARLLRIKAVVNASSSTDYYTRWARWFFANRDTRPPFPE